MERHAKKLILKGKNMTEEIEVIAGSTTLLIYMAADNDLDAFAEKDLVKILFAENIGLVLQAKSDAEVEAKLNANQIQFFKIGNVTNPAKYIAFAISRSELLPFSRIIAAFGRGLLASITGFFPVKCVGKLNLLEP